MSSFLAHTYAGDIDLHEEQKEFFALPRHRYAEEVEKDSKKKYGESSFLTVPAGKWRLEGRMRTVSVALCVCLNIGVDPPDVVKPQPCARLEAWIDPLALPPQNGLDSVGGALQKQYERWQPRARYKQALDPTIGEVKRLCVNLRRAAKEERVLFHYCGHGVPRPSSNGELWVFNESYTQYIPLSIFDLQMWMKGPSIYVFDCSAAGLIIDAFKHFQEQKAHGYQPTQPITAQMQMQMKQYRAGSGGQGHAPAEPHESILLAACEANQILPVNPELPADIFTACLTTPIKIALRWFASRSVLTNVTPEMIDKIPGKPNERRSPLGELNWIFTAITDTIAWNVLPKDLFQKLFRQDLLLSSLFRNFLLADRILRSVGCTPVSSPKLPATYKHPMWNSWDLAAEFCLSQLERYCRNETTEYQRTSFFADQLTAFGMWLEFGTEDSPPPMQLPIVLQVLLSQDHRRRALYLLARFLDKGPWAVNLALSVGIFPYVLKLLQSPAVELREVLVFIWTKILAYDPRCQHELVKDNYQQYFVNHLASQNASDRQRIMCAFVLSVISRHHRPGQDALLASGVFRVLASSLDVADPLLRRWMCLLIAVMWEKHEDAKWAGINLGIHERLCVLLKDVVPEVRACAAYALGTMMGGCSEDKRIYIELAVGRKLGQLMYDGSCVVRREMIIALSELVYHQKMHFAQTADERGNEESKFSSDQSKSQPNPGVVTPSTTPGTTPGTTPHPASPSPDLSTPPYHTSHHATSRGPEVIYEDSSQRPPPSADKHKEKVRTPEYQRSILWRVVVSCCRDSYPQAAAAALALKEYVHSLRPNKQSIPRGSLTDGATDRRHSDAKIGLSNVMGGDNFTHFDRYKMMHMKHQGSESVGVGSGMSIPDNAANAGSLRRVGRKHHRLSNMENASPHDFDDPRTLDPSWSVPISTIYEMSAVYFSKPLRQNVELEDSVETLLNKKWRYKRNKDLSSQARQLRHRKFGKDDEKGAFHQLSVFPCGLEQVSKVQFHPYESILFAADARDRIAVCDYKELDATNKFCNENSRGTRITDLKVANDLHISLLITATDEGVVRVWNQPHVKDQQKLVATWMALKLSRHRSRSHRARRGNATPTGTPAVSRRDSGSSVPGALLSPKSMSSQPASTSQHKEPSNMLIDWQQYSGHLLAGGSSDVIRVWDMTQESCLLDVPSHSKYAVTSITSSYEGHLLYTGYADGTVRMFDLRAHDSMIKELNKRHRGKVVQVALQRGGVEGAKLVSAGLKGEVYLYDINMGGEIKRLVAHSSSSLNCLAIHDQANLLASGSHKQFIKVFDTEGNQLNKFKYHEGFLGQRIGPVNSLSFHPHKLLLATGANDFYVSIHAGDDMSSRLLNLSETL